MSSPAQPFRAAQEAALRASSALAQAMGGQIRIYAEVPQSAPLPYVVIGQDEIDDLSEDCGEVHSIVSTVQWWAKLTGAVKGADTVRAMGAAIVGALKTDLAITGHDVVLAIMEIPERYATDPDQSSRGLVAFRYETTAQDS
jgi:hypothetical protein